jgi:DNA-directed RNA polymerase specialized sigma24 family protein
MYELEAKEGVYSLDHGFEIASAKADRPDSSALDCNTPDANGGFTDSNGRSWAADVSLSNAPLDVSKMTLDWVNSTEDPLFCDLTRKERHLLYLVFAREMSWNDIASSFDVTVRTVKNIFTSIISGLQAKVAEHEALVERRKVA